MINLIGSSLSAVLSRASSIRSLARARNRARTSFRRYSPVGGGGGLSNSSILYGIIGANTVVFATWSIAERGYSLRKFMREHFTVSAAGVLRQHNFHTLITSCFSHNEMWHFAFNMITFYTFASTPLAVLGGTRFLALYFGGGLVSSFAQIMSPYIIPDSWPASRYGYLTERTAGLGASGAINALVAWNILAMPRATVLLYGIIPMPLALFGLGFIAMDAYSLYFGGTNVGNAAHLSGAAVGTIFFLVTRRSTPFGRF